MTKQQICVLPLTVWLELQSLQWEIQAWNYSEVTAPPRILPDGNLKKDCWLLLRCIAHLFRVITRCKTKNRPFSSDPLQLESAHDNPEDVSGYSVLKLPQFSFKTQPVFLISPMKMQMKIKPVKGHWQASTCLSSSQFASSWWGRNHIQNLEQLSDDTVLFSSGYLIIC